MVTRDTEPRLSALEWPARPFPPFLLWGLGLAGRKPIAWAELAPSPALLVLRAFTSSAGCPLQEHLGAWAPDPSHGRYLRCGAEAWRSGGHRAGDAGAQQYGHPDLQPGGSTCPAARGTHRGRAGDNGTEPR